MPSLNAQAKHPVSITLNGRTRTGHASRFSYRATSSASGERAIFPRAIT